MLRTLAVVALWSLPALALPRGGTLYVAAPSVKLLKEPKATSKPASPRELPRGTEVTWLGASAKDPHFQEVEVAGQKGFLETQHLTLSKPVVEVDVSGRPMSAEAFASSGARVVDADMGRGTFTPTDEQADADLAAVEALNRATATPQAVAAKRKSLQGR
jgi:hypothetical protein